MQLTVSRQLVSAVIAAAGFSRKKVRPKASRKSPEQAQEFSRQLLSLQGREIVSVDESGFDSKPRPVYGYAKKGHRATAQCRQSSDRTRHTLLMAVSSHASSHHVFHSGRVNGKTFAEFVESMPFPSGAVLVLDNASIHKTREVQQVMARKGYTPMYTPPYSPGFNPIEHCFGAIKTQCKQHSHTPHWSWPRRVCSNTWRSCQHAVCLST